MKRLLLFLLLFNCSTLFAAQIVNTPVTTPQAADKISIGRLQGGVAQAVTVGGILKAGLPATFSNISAAAITVPQGISAQSIQLYEAAANGSNKATIQSDSALSSDILIVIKSDGLYVNGVQKLSW